MHVRRGDRCVGAASLRCGDMSMMPFLSVCRGDPAAPAAPDRAPLYVSTDETDPGRGGVENRLSTDGASPPPPPRVCMNIHLEG